MQFWHLWFFNNRGDTVTNTNNSSMKSSKIPGATRNSMLTLENIKMHERQIQQTNHKFYPRINKLVEVANKRYAKDDNRGKLGASTNFTKAFSVFDALYELESFNQIPSIKGPKSDFEETQDDNVHRHHSQQVLS